MQVLTIEQMLVLFLVIQVATVLLDLVNAQRARVDRLDPQVVVLKSAIELAFLIALGILELLR